MTIKMILVAFVAAIITILGLYIIACLGISCYKALKKQWKQ